LNSIVIVLQGFGNLAGIYVKLAQKKCLQGFGNFAGIYVKLAQKEYLQGFGNLAGKQKNKE
jgi:hypothetical protein